MAKELWIKEAENQIEREVDLAIWSIENLATEKDIDVAWALEVFSNKLAYKVKEINKNR